MHQKCRRLSGWGVGCAGQCIYSTIAAHARCVSMCACVRMTSMRSCEVRAYTKTRVLVRTKQGTSSPSQKT